MVKKQSHASKGMKCLGVLGSGEKCKRARNGSGDPVVLNRVCDNCKEQRCRQHCRCGRSKSTTAQGRSAARGRCQALAAPAAAAMASLRGPVGRAPEPSCLWLEVEAYYARCCTDIAGASEVELASYMYDCPSLQRALLKKLRGRSAFALNVYLDAEMFAAGVPKSQRVRCKALLDAGAQFFFVQGAWQKWSFPLQGYCCRPALFVLRQRQCNPEVFCQC